MGGSAVEGKIKEEDGTCGRGRPEGESKARPERPPAAQAMRQESNNSRGHQTVIEQRINQHINQR
jgi:hypothetical protein